MGGWFGVVVKRVLVEYTGICIFAIHCEQTVIDRHMDDEGKGFSASSGTTTSMAGRMVQFLIKLYCK